ncbi:MAG: hypothetical protein ABRQ39_15060 [Candidatus Eremiobacterota bacterium]
MYVKRYRDRKKIYLPEVSLCQMEGHSCAGCCINLYEYDDIIAEFLAVNTRSFQSFFPDLKTVNPTFLQEYLTELKKINNRDPVFLMYNCYFAGFIDREEKKTGCLVHPLRLDGIELRDLLSVNCVPYGKCYRDILWHNISDIDKKKFLSMVKDYDWLAYSRNIYKSIPDLYAPEIKENHFYNIVVKDHGIQAGSKLKKNLDLISEFYSMKEESKSHEDMLFKYGELYLEKILREISGKNNIFLAVIDIPEDLTRDGDEYINGERLYVLFAQSSLNTNKTIMLGTGYNNSNEKLSCNDMKKAKTVSFLIESLLKSGRRPDVNYLWLFSGGEKDILHPLKGPFYFNDILKKGFCAETKTITAEDIIIYMHFDGILRNNIHSAIDYHIPCSQSYLTDIETYYRDFIYINIENSLADTAGMKVIDNYFIDLFDARDLNGIDNILCNSLKEILKEKTPLTVDNIIESCRVIFKDVFGFSEEEKNKSIEQMKEYIIKKIYNPAREIDVVKIEERLAEKGILLINKDKKSRFIVTTHNRFTEDFFELLVHNGFTRDKDQYGINKGFYPFASSGIPCVCISGSEEKGVHGDINRFLDTLSDYLGKLEYTHDRNFIKIIDR